MIQVNFLNKIDLLTIPVKRISTSNSTNTIYVQFETDNEARDAEVMFKEHGYKTEHTDCTIRVMNFNNFDIYIPD